MRPLPHSRSPSLRSNYTPGAWTWPFVVQSFVRGRPIADLRPDLSPDDLKRAAQYLGRALRLVHETPLDETSLTDPLDPWAAFRDYLRKQQRKAVRNYKRSGYLNKAVLGQIPSYLPSDAAVLCDETRQRACFLHGDLTEDNLLGMMERGKWVPRGLIDFGDALVGHRVYELTPIYVDIFKLDKYPPPPPLPLSRSFIQVIAAGAHDGLWFRPVRCGPVCVHGHVLHGDACARRLSFHLPRTPRPQGRAGREAAGGAPFCLSLATTLTDSPRLEARPSRKSETRGSKGLETPAAFHLLEHDKGEEGVRAEAEEVGREPLPQSKRPFCRHHLARHVRDSSIGVHPGRVGLHGLQPSLGDVNGDGDGRGEKSRHEGGRHMQPHRVPKVARRLEAALGRGVAPELGTVEDHGPEESEGRKEGTQTG